MREINCQSLIVSLVKAHGGAAHKLSNRFLIGVCDLLVKLPAEPAALIEAKLERITLIAPTDRSILLEVTKLQRAFLLEYYRAGMICGVASFVERGEKGLRGLSVGLFRLDVLEQRGYSDGYLVSLLEHVSLSDHPTRDQTLLEQLRKFCRG